MTFENLLNNLQGASSIVLTGLLKEENCQSIFDILQPSESQCLGTFFDTRRLMGDIPYTFKIFGERGVADQIEPVDVICIYNNTNIKPASELIDALLPKVKQGGHLICVDYEADFDTELTQVDENTTDHPPNWYRQA